MVLCVVLGYVIGSLPTAYLLVRWKSHVDIRNAGSGNVGTLNSLQVSHSWLVGGIVLVVDLLKGAAAAMVGAEVGGGSTLFAALGGVGGILGHNYPVWLRFRGGRGLAPGAGAFLVVCRHIVPAWLILWLAGYALMRRVNPANAFASAILLLVAVLVPSSVFEFLGMGADSVILRWFIVTMMGIILLRHLDPVKEFVAEKKQRRAGSC